MSDSIVQIICSAITFAGVVITAIMGFVTARRSARAEELAKKNAQESEEMKERSKLRKRESLLSLRMNDAIIQLAIVTANAVTGGHNNGNVERAQKAVKEVSEEYQDFLRETMANEINE